MSAQPPWLASQVQALLAQPGHAWLLAGPSGLGQFELALALARAWLCEQPQAHGACGHCASCHAIDVHTHADLSMLLPETTALRLAWPLGDQAQDEIDSKKRKPSKEIRVDAMRSMLEFAQRTSGRGRGKVVLIFPAERMNQVSANALLKTLEEPAGALRFVLASEAAHQLPATIRSRCLVHTMAWPDPDLALHWLVSQGLSADLALASLRAAGGRAQDALQFAAMAELWAQVPRAVQRGDVGFFADWSAAQLIDGLQKLCHDVLTFKAGGLPRFFSAADLPATAGSWAVLTGWAKQLAHSRRTIEHPFQAGLLQEALIQQAQMALNSKP